MLVWTASPHNENRRRVVLLDRDGVVNSDRPDHVKSWGEYSFYPDALEAFRWLRQHEIDPVLISNQSGLNRGITGWSDFWDIHFRMLSHIRQVGGELAAAFYCPHRPDEGCDCRKPREQMFKSASRILYFELNESFFIGDRLSDMDAAHRAGCRGVLLKRDCVIPADSFQPDSRIAQYCSMLDAVTNLFADGH